MNTFILPFISCQLYLNNLDLKFLAQIGSKILQKWMIISVIDAGIKAWNKAMAIFSERLKLDWLSEKN